MIRGASEKKDCSITDYLRSPQLNGFGWVSVLGSMNRHRRQQKSAPMTPPLLVAALHHISPRSHHGLSGQARPGRLSKRIEILCLKVFRRDLLATDAASLVIKGVLDFHAPVVESGVQPHLAFPAPVLSELWRGHRVIVEDAV